MPRGHARSRSGPDDRLTAGQGHFGSPLSWVRLEEQLCRSGRVSSASEATIRGQRSTDWTMGRRSTAVLSSVSGHDRIFDIRRHLRRRRTQRPDRRQLPRQGRPQRVPAGPAPDTGRLGPQRGVDRCPASSTTPSPPCTRSSSGARCSPSWEPNWPNMVCAYVQGQTSTGASFPDGRSAVIETDPDALGAELDRLGERHAWTQLMTDVSQHLDSLGPLLGMDLASPEAAGLLRALCRDTGSSVPFTALLSGSGCDLLGDRFASEELIMAWLPWLLHVGLGPRDAGGALWSVLLMATLLAGNPAPVGGSGRLAEALTGLVTAHGAEIRTSVEVDAIVTTGGRATGVRTTDGEQLTATQAVIASTTPDQLYGRLLRDAAGIPRINEGAGPRLSVPPRLLPDQPRAVSATPLRGFSTRRWRRDKRGPRPERTHGLRWASRRRIAADPSVDLLARTHRGRSQSRTCGTSCGSAAGARCALAPNGRRGRGDRRRRRMDHLGGRAIRRPGDCRVRTTHLRAGADGGGPPHPEPRRLGPHQPQRRTWRPRLRTQRALPGVHPASHSGTPRRICHRRT